MKQGREREGEGETEGGKEKGEGRAGGRRRSRNGDEGEGRQGENSSKSSCSLRTDVNVFMTHPQVKKATFKVMYTLPHHLIDNRYFHHMPSDTGRIYKK